MLPLLAHPDDFLCFYCGSSGIERDWILPDEAYGVNYWVRACEVCSFALKGTCYLTLGARAHAAWASLIKYYAQWDLTQEDDASRYALLRVARASTLATILSSCSVFEAANIERQSESISSALMYARERIWPSSRPTYDTLDSVPLYIPPDPREYTPDLGYGPGHDPVPAATSGDLLAAHSKYLVAKLREWSKAATRTSDPNQALFLLGAQLVSKRLEAISRAVSEAV